MPIPFSMVNTVERILTGVHALESRDRVVDAEIARLGGIAGRWTGGLIAAIIATVLLVILTGNGAPTAFLLFLTIPTAIACLVMTIIYNTRKGGWEKQDIENRRLALIDRLFTVLGEDIPRKAKCAVEAYFDHYRTHGTLVDQQKGGLFNPITTMKFVDHWFTARGQLYDGNRFKISITQIIHRKEKRKRKYTKVNERISEEVTLLLKLDPAAYPHAASIVVPSPGVVEGVQITRVQAQGNLLRVTARTPEVHRLTGRGGSTSVQGDGLAHGDLLLWLLSFAYAQLKDARATEAA